MRTAEWIVSIGVLFTLQGCWALKYYEYDYVNHRRIPVRNLPITIPVGVKNAKKHIVPSIDFMNSIKAFRETRGTLPSSILELMNSSLPARKSVEEMYASGFNNLDVLFYSPDSTKVWFSHEPVYRQKVGHTDFGGTYINGTFVFIYNDSSFQVITRYE